jgi:hypothetical protein
MWRPETTKKRRVFRKALRVGTKFKFKKNEKSNDNFRSNNTYSY